MSALTFVFSDLIQWNLWPPANQRRRRGVLSWRNSNLPFTRDAAVLTRWQLKPRGVRYMWEKKRKISTGICVYFHIQYSFVLLFDTNINLLWISSRTPPTDEHVQLLPISSLLDWTYYFQHQGEKCWSHYCSDSDFTAYSEPNKNDVQPWLLKNTSHSYHFANDLII